MRRLAALADIHGNFLALQAVCEDLAERNVSEVVNLGDHISGPLWPRETIRFLMARDWLHVMGNHDRQVCGGDASPLGPSDSYAFERIGAGELEWLSSLPPRLRGDVGLLAFHGAPSSDEEYLLESVAGGLASLSPLPRIAERLGSARAAMILCGHSHVQRCVRLDDGGLIVNPGSVGLQAYLDDGEFPHKVESGSPHARYAIIEERDGEWTAEFLLVAYDWAAAAEKARLEGRSDWEEALRSGFVSRRY